ncbi:hypothetical protein ISS05_02745 [Candidatus Woesearchaeota archaeon]|nr:hypothetical protein [Candidatus Woesearchaeota archaeon]
MVNTNKNSGKRGINTFGLHRLTYIFIVFVIFLSYSLNVEAGTESMPALTKTTDFNILDDSNIYNYFVNEDDDMIVQIDTYNQHNDDLVPEVYTYKQFKEVFDFKPKAPSTTKVYSSANCKRLRYTGNPQTKLDLVFVPSSQYSETGDGSQFAEDVESFLEEIYDFPQLAENLNRMNIYRIDDLDVDDNCRAQYGTPMCDKFRIKARAEQCVGWSLDNNDQVITILNLTSANITRSVAFIHGYVFMANYFPRALTHELGHSIFGLGDEYDGIYEMPVEPLYPNVASTTSGNSCMDKWGDLYGIEGIVGCFQNANAINWYRPTEISSIMRSLAVHRFCPVSERVVDEYLSIYSDRIRPRPRKWAFMSAPGNII